MINLINGNICREFLLKSVKLNIHCRRGLVDSVLAYIMAGFKPLARHQRKIQKVYFSSQFPFSRFLAKTLRVNKTAMKSLPKESGVRNRL